ncbi:MAG TPA: hypothetical protein VFZ73_07850 [Gemmatimonadaceae bacterium]
MSKRLQVLLEESELAEIRRAARLSRMTVAEWVRQALRRARREEPMGRCGDEAAGTPRATLSSLHWLPILHYR